MLRAAGERAVATGNVGLPVVDAVTADPPYDVLAVELSSFQLHSAPSVRPAAAAILNLAPDHLDWHGDFAAYAAAKAADLGRREDRGHRQRRRSRGRRGGWPPLRAGRSRSRWPSPGRTSSGVRGGRLVDRAFGGGAIAGGRARSARPDRTTSPTRWPPPRWPARTASTRPRSRAGLRAFVPDPHRNEPVARRRRRPLRRRQQGDQPARRAGLARRVRPGCLDRRRPAQGRAGGRAGRAGRRPARRRGAARRRPRRAGHGDRATRPQPPRGDRLQDRRWGDVRGGGGGRGARRARRHGAAGAGRRLDGHVPGLQGPRRRVRRGGARAGGRRDRDRDRARRSRPTTASLVAGPPARPRCT